MQRIHVIGGPGSGKTTLARRIAALGSLPVCNLDAVAYEDGAGTKRSLDARLVDIGRIAAQPAWVTEGSFLWWTTDLLERADAIVWLDVPWRLAAWRILRRHLLASLAGTNRHRGIRRLLSFLGSARRFYVGPAVNPAASDDDGAVTRVATTQELAAFGHKLIRCRRPADVEAFLSQWQHPPSEFP